MSHRRRIIRIDGCCHSTVNLCQINPVIPNNNTKNVAVDIVQAVEGGAEDDRENMQVALQVLLRIHKDLQRPNLPSRRRIQGHNDVHPGRQNSLDPLMSRGLPIHLAHHAESGSGRRLPKYHRRKHNQDPLSLKNASPSLQDDLENRWAMT